MSANINLLLTGAGTQTFANVFFPLKKAKNVNTRIIAADASHRAYGLYLADKSYLIPRADSSAFIPRLLKICLREKISVLIPLLSLEYPKFSKDKDLFKKHGVVIPVSDYRTVRICNDKKLTYDFFLKNKISAPRTYTPGSTNARIKFPLVVKPRRLSGSKHFHLVKSSSELTRALKTVPRPIVQEYLSGQEYTVDVLADYSSRPIVIVPRLRLKVMEGKSVCGKTVNDTSLITEVSRIIHLLKLIGPANIQCFKVGRKFYFTEVNPRFSAGGLPLTVAAGINTPYLLLKMALGEKIDPPARFTENLYLFRYFTEIIVKQKDLITNSPYIASSRA